MKRWRPLAVASVLCLVLGADLARAQTVIVQNAPPGSTVEVLLNETSLGSATVDPRGVATVSKKVVPGETSAHVYVDTCGTTRRVLLVEPGLQAPTPGPSCTRREISGLFVVKPITTFVVDVGAASPQVWLRQGAVPESWLRPGEGGIAAEPERTAPTGLVLFGGATGVKFADVATRDCGSVSGCSGKDFKAGYGAGIAYWFTRFTAAEASYLKPANATTSGSGTTYSFNGTYDVRVLTLMGKVGAAIGAVRVYGEGGMNYHRGTSTTNETISDRTEIVNDVPVTIPGGPQVFQLKTGGWGYVFGGGLEGWISPSVAIYGEFIRAKLNGSPLEGGQGVVDDSLTMILAGLRVHIGR